MVFGLFSNPKKNQAKFEEGKKLFELGMIYASNFESKKALQYYQMSIDACENPAPYINRANLLSKRMREYEALQDLLRAKKLDEEQGNDFGPVLRREIAQAKVVTNLYFNETREKLIRDLKERGHNDVAGKIFCNCFGIKYDWWEHSNFNREIVEFHFFNELDNIVKFDDIDGYPDAKEFVELFPERFIQMKAGNCPDEKLYVEAYTKLQAFLCVYLEEDMRALRNYMLYDIHRKLMTRDFGDFYDSLSSNCRGLTKEAEEYIEDTPL